MGAYLKVCEGGTYSEKQFFVFFTAVFKDYTRSKCLCKYVQSYLIVQCMPYMIKYILVRSKM